MAIKLTKRFLDELKRCVNSPNVVVELALDGGTRYFGYHGKNSTAIVRFSADASVHADGSVHAVGSDEISSFVQPLLKSVSSLQNKIDPGKGFSTRGELKIVISGRENFKPLLRDEYLKNRRVTRRDGFIAPGLAYSDYAATFTGVISDWSRKGDEIRITVADDLADAGSTKVPTENEDGTQYLDYTCMHPVDIMTDILTNQLGIEAGYIDTNRFTEEGDLWLNGSAFSRVLTEPEEANKYLNELQVETNSFIVHDGEKVSLKVFAPPSPGLTTEEWTDNFNILEGSFSQKSGYKDNFYNRVVVYYDYDESGGDGSGNFESAVISLDAASQGAAEWDEASTKTIKSKWIRTRTWTQPLSISGVTVYHCSRNNPTGGGTLSFTYDAGGEHTLQWTCPGGAQGSAVTVSQCGKYDIYSKDETKWIRVIVDYNTLPPSTRTDTITITALNGASLATTLANKLLYRYRSPVSTVSFEVDINNVAYNNEFIKPTDLKDISTDEACEYGLDGWVRERVMITGVRPDFSDHTVKVEAVSTKMSRRYGFIAPAGQPDYSLASTGEREYAFIGDANNMVNGGTEDGYYIW
ncbi:MAG: hypothetical protein ACE5EB_08275 [Thermodesulfobacteriota bacterium]